MSVSTGRFTSHEASAQAFAAARNLLPDTEHAAHPWRIHEIAEGFRLENVWSIQTPGAGADDFHAALDALLTPRGTSAFAGTSLPFRALLAIRRRLGRLLRWDAPAPHRGRRLLRDQLPSDLQGAPPAPGFASMTLVYRLHDEAAYEFTNTTVHGVMHLGWTRTADGGYELRMAEMTKPNGWRGRTYMAAIAPFRRRIAVPALLRHWERAWAQRDVRSDKVTQVEGEANLPDGIRSLSSLTTIDHVDHLSCPTHAEATAEEWARAMFGDEPDLAERLIWKGFLRLRLSPDPSPDTVAGWRIATREPDWIRLEAQSWFLTGNLIVRAPGDHVSLTTCLYFDRPIGRTIWALLLVLHRRLTPALLTDAVSSISRIDHAGSK